MAMRIAGLIVVRSVISRCAGIVRSIVFERVGESDCERKWLWWENVEMDGKDDVRRGVMRGYMDGRCIIMRAYTLRDVKHLSSKNQCIDDALDS